MVGDGGEGADKYGSDGVGTGDGVKDVFQPKMSCSLSLSGM